MDKHVHKYVRTPPYLHLTVTTTSTRTVHVNCSEVGDCS